MTLQTAHISLRQLRVATVTTTEQPRTRNLVHLDVSILLSVEYMQPKTAGWKSDLLFHVPENQITFAKGKNFTKSMENIWQRKARTRSARHPHLQQGRQSNSSSPCKEPLFPTHRIRPMHSRARTSSFLVLDFLTFSGATEILDWVPIHPTRRRPLTLQRAKQLLGELTGLSLSEQPAAARRFVLSRGTPRPHRGTESTRKITYEGGV